MTTPYVPFDNTMLIVNYCLIHKVTVDEAIKALGINASLTDKINAVSILMKMQS